MVQKIIKKAEEKISQAKEDYRRRRDEIREDINVELKETLCGKWVKWKEGEKEISAFVMEVFCEKGGDSIILLCNKTIHKFKNTTTITEYEENKKFTLSVKNDITVVKEEEETFIEFLFIYKNEYYVQKVPLKDIIKVGDRWQYSFENKEEDLEPELKFVVSGDINENGEYTTDDLQVLEQESGDTIVEIGYRKSWIKCNAFR